MDVTEPAGRTCDDVHDAATEDVDELRERVRRLELLYEGAQQMSAGLDLDGVLATICARARGVTCADVGYLLEYDPDADELFIRAHDGIRTEAFTRARVRRGEGLAGKVMAERRTCHSADYVRDDSFPHPFDDVVGAEGLVSVIGVPLVVEDEVIAVLLVACRRRTAFSAEDEQALEALAGHGAIALANARLHGRTVELARRERQMRDEAEASRRRVEELHDLERRLSALTLLDLPIDALLPRLGGVIGFHVRVIPETEHPSAVRVAAGTLQLGWLAPVQPDALDDRARHALDAAARVVAVHLLRARAVAMAEDRLRSEFVSDVLAGEEELEALTRRGRFLGIDLDQPLALMLVGDLPDDERAHAALRRGLAALDAPSLPGRTGGRVVVLTTGDGQVAAQTLHHHLGDAGFAPTVAVAGEVRAGALGGVHDELRKLVDSAGLAGRAGTVVARGELGVYPLLLAEGTGVEPFAHALLAPLVDYDRANGTDLLVTLDTYLRHGARAAESARALHVHVNSLYYRLQRIREILDVDLHEPDARLQIEIAARIVARDHRDGL